ncbi:chlorocatechol-degradation protein [Pluteus cervinus]|uniref:Chlorocatechol-degradation protein n=1 Tax=Pluteus cervinus TaxID=181527 RepID=A0ACD3AWE1_9AGAR|nr:chlorocatechol-degradation protein [Pluteus cervinus]
MKPQNLCSKCLDGTFYDGTPRGKWENISDVACYVATPERYASRSWARKIVLYLPDAYGPQLLNNQLLADDFAKKGFKTVIPDIFDGEPVPLEARFNTFNVPKWLARHGDNVVRPIIDRVIAALKKQGVQDFLATGYCMGGRYVFDLAFDNIVKVAAVSHPTLLQSPTDFEKYKSLSKAPLLMNTCDFDPWFPPESQAKASECLSSFPHKFARRHWEGCTHGFAVRGDMNNPKVKAGKEGAFLAVVDWFEAHSMTAESRM